MFITSTCFNPNVTVFILFLFFVILACGPSAKEMELAKEKTKRQLRLQRIDEVAAKYNASRIDTLRIPLTYFYQKHIKANSKVLIADFEIRDIKKKGERYIMSIKSWQLSDNYYELECDSLTIEKLINTKPDPYYTNRDLILVADISAVEKIKFEILPSGEYDSETEQSNFYIDVNDSFDKFIMKGKLIGFERFELGEKK